jgi:hypothetical protein
MHACMHAFDAKTCRYSSTLLHLTFVLSTIGKTRKCFHDSFFFFSFFTKLPPYRDPLFGGQKRRGHKKVEKSVDQHAIFTQMTTRSRPWSLWKLACVHMAPVGVLGIAPSTRNNWGLDWRHGPCHSAASNFSTLFQDGHAVAGQQVAVVVTAQKAHGCADMNCLYLKKRI